jgi:hypothetical protein
LFGPRNEFLSFIVLTPSLAALAGLILMRDDADYRGWLLVAAALVLGLAWGLEIDGVLKPAIVTAICVWLAWLMAMPVRWSEIVQSPEPVRADPGEHVAADTVASHR